MIRAVGATAAQSSGQSVGTLAVGSGADFVVLDTDAPHFAGATASDVIDRWIFSGNRNLARDVYVAGEPLVVDGRHRDRDAIAGRFGKAMHALLA